jgi:hypothetical protein
MYRVEDDRELLILVLELEPQVTVAHAAAVMPNQLE